MKNVGEILIDYTSIVSATNAINPDRVFYPLSVRHPYEELFDRKSIPADSPAWIEFASLADIIEHIILNEILVVSRFGKSDRVSELGSHTRKASVERDVYAFLVDKGVLSELEPTQQELEQLKNVVIARAKSPAFCKAFIESFFALMRNPGYSQIPDLFSFSQTVYKFDGETIWQWFSASFNNETFSKVVNETIKEMNPRIELNYTGFFYFEEILGFLLRSLLYNELAKFRGIPYSPHLARVPFVMSDGLSSIDETIQYGRVAIEHIVDLRKELAEHRNGILKRHIYDLKLPPLFTYALKQISKPEDLLKVAWQIRETKGAKSFRRWSLELSDAILQERSIDADSMLAQLSGLIDDLRKELGLKSVETSMSLWLFRFPIKVPKFMHKVIIPPGNQHLQFIRDLFKGIEGVRSIENEIIRIFTA